MLDDADKRIAEVPKEMWMIAERLQFNIIQ